MLNYVEYKNLCAAGMAGIAAASKHTIESNMVLSASVMSEIASMSIEATGLSDRLTDVVSSRGYLGFLIMVSRFPDLFYMDRGFWLDYHLACRDLTIMTLEGADKETIELTEASPEYVMVTLFIENPSTVIKRV